MPTLGHSNENTSSSAAPAATHRGASTWEPYGDSPYLLGEHIASGGMGSVHLALKHGALGFRRFLALKRLHQHLAQNPDFVARFKDEIRLVSRLNHPNVVQTFDVLEVNGELALVLEYVHGITLHQLQRCVRAAGERLPIPVAVGIVAQALHGLHCAHELCDDDGSALCLVHRDVSPQNIMIGRDGLVKVLDFGVAKASSELHVTRAGQITGKPAYMAPEQVAGFPLDRRSDVFAAGVVLWEALTGKRLFRPSGVSEAVALRNVLDLGIPPPSELRPELEPKLERIVLRALERDPARRYGSARDFALALEEAVPEASASTVANAAVRYGAAVLSQGPTVAPPASSAHSRPTRAQSAPTVAAPTTSEEPTCLLGASISDVRTGPAPPTPAPRARQRLLFSALALGGALGLFSIYRADISLVTERLPDVPGADRAAQQTTSGSRDAPGSSKALTARAAGSASQPATRSSAPLRAASSDSPARPTASSEQSPVSQESGFEQRRAVTSQRTAAWQNAAARQNAVESSAASHPKGGSRRRASSSAPPAPQPHPSTKTQPGPTAPSAPRPAVTPQATSATKPPSARDRAAPSCTPPTYTDAEGIRHFKPECL